MRISGALFNINQNAWSVFKWNTSLLLKSVLWIFWDYMKGAGVGIACRTKAKDKVLDYWLKMAYNKRLKERISENKHVNVSRALKTPVLSSLLTQSQYSRHD